MLFRSISSLHLYESYDDDFISRSAGYFQRLRQCTEDLREVSLQSAALETMRPEDLLGVESLTFRLAALVVDPYLHYSVRA